MRDVLRAGFGVFNAGRYHAAHDAWEERWLQLETGTADERLLHGLIQYTAAIHHAHDGNREGATGLAESASGYLAGLPATYRGVALQPVRATLAALAVDPYVVYRSPVPPLLYDGAAVALADLDPVETAIAARVIAATEDAYDPDLVGRAGEYAARGGPDNRFEALLADFVADPEHRDLVYRRLQQHLERETAKDADVEGLFDADQSS